MRDLEAELAQLKRKVREGNAEIAVLKRKIYDAKHGVRQELPHA